MNSRIKAFAIAAIILASLQTFSQTKKEKAVSTSGTPAGYKTAVGFRLGGEGGITVKHFMNKNAIEGILSRGWGYGGFRITGLYEIQKPIASAAGLSWFFGFGAHIGFYNAGYYGYYGYNNGGYYDKHGNWHATGYRRNYMSVGIDGILGLEYTFPDAPLNIALDIKPYVDFLGYSNRFVDGALSIRYAIK
jgi:hypothetical protein